MCSLPNIHGSERKSHAILIALIFMWMRFQSFCCMLKMNQNKAVKLYSENKEHMDRVRAWSKPILSEAKWCESYRALRLKKKDVHSSLSFENVNKSDKHIDNFSKRDLISFNYFERTTSQCGIPLLLFRVLLFRFHHERFVHLRDNKVRFATMWQ